MAATPGTVDFNGRTYEVSTSFAFASFYFPNYKEHNGIPMIRFHRTAASAAKGSYDSKEQRANWSHVGWTAVQR